jgi:hypothetical protein
MLIYLFLRQNAPKNTKNMRNCNHFRLKKTKNAATPFENSALLSSLCVQGLYI